MLKRVIIRNFKQFEQIEVELSRSVVLIGPNNSGKTSLFQALCLWEIGVRKYAEAKRMGRLSKAGAVTLNRQVLANAPIDSVRLLWKDQKATAKTEHLPLDVTLEGENDGCDWICTTRFLYCNEESFSCRIAEGEAFIEKFLEKDLVRFGFLQTMSGISSMEDKLTAGSIARYLGEGKTAEVIRNLCYNMLYPEQNRLHDVDTECRWNRLVQLMRRMFGVVINRPVYIKETGIIDLSYESEGRIYPISSAGRGFQQILLLLTYILSNQSTVLLLDEPDAHLEIVRQREVFSLINDLAEENGTQVLIASHSEVILKSASESDSEVVALVERKAYPVLARKDIAAVRNALVTYGWDKYAAARMYGHILFLEGETDLKMLMGFADVLNHPVKDLLRKANVQYVNGNDSNYAKQAFEAFRRFFPELRGFALFDRLEKSPSDMPGLTIHCLCRREIENYFAAPDTMLKYAESLSESQGVSKEDLRSWMNEAIENNTVPAKLRNLDDAWWKDAKLTDEWLDVIFPEFNGKLPQRSNNKNFKTDYYKLIPFVCLDKVDAEIVSVLDDILKMLRTHYI